MMTFNFDVDAKDAIKKIGRFQKDLGKKVADSEKAIKKMDKGFFKFVKQVRAVGPHSKGITTMTHHMKELSQYVTKTVPQLQALADASAKSGDTEMLADVEKKIKKLQDTYKEMGRGQETIEKDSVDIQSLIDGAQEAGEALTAPLQEVLNRDVLSVYKRASDLVAKTLNSTTGKIFSKLQTLAGAKAAKHQASGNKMMGGMFKALESVSKIFAQLGPLVQIASSFMMSFVKIMIDGEAAAKDYNKQILASAGTSEFLHDNMKNVTVAAADLEKSLKDARSGAMGFDGVMKAIDTSRWGINKETAAAFQNSLTAEGVSLRKLGGEFERATGYAKDHATAIQMSVAYSRAFGVSLSELTQLQGSMMSDMGMSIDKVQTSFQLMANAAHESGIATNKFFGIIRGFSSDLSLFTLRMEDLTKVMKVLGKTMDPREAQKFLQTMTQKFQGGLDDNLKHVIIAGEGETKARAQEDLADKIGTLMENVESTLGKGSATTTAAIKDLQEILANPKRDPRAIAQWAAKQEVKLDGNVVSSLLDAANMQTQLAKGDAISLASVADQLSPLAKMDITQSEIRRLTGKGFDQLSGIDLMAVERAGIASAQEIRAFQKFNQGILSAQEELIARVSKGQATQEDIAKLSKMGVAYTKDNPKKMAEDLRSAFVADKGNRRFWSTMSEDQKKLLGDSAVEIDYQKETATFQVSALDRLGVVADVLMNQIYNILVSIWETITDAVGRLLGGKDAELKRAQVAAGRSRDADLIKAITEASSYSEAKKNIIEDVGKPLMEQAQAATAELKSIRSSAPENEADMKKKAARAKELEPLAKFADLTHANAYTVDKSLPELLDSIKQMKEASKNFKDKGFKGPDAPIVVKAPEPETPRIDALPVEDPLPTEGLPTAAPMPMPAPALIGGVDPAPALIGGKPEYPTTPPAIAAITGVKDQSGTKNSNVTVDLRLNGDLARFVDARVINGTANFERNKRHR